MGARLLIRVGALLRREGTVDDDAVDWHHCHRQS